MNSKKGFILYFDILGYKDLLLENAFEDNEKIFSILEKFSDFFEKTIISLGFGCKFDINKLFLRSFSDNFLFVYELNKDDYYGLLIIQSIATRIQNQFLNAGLLIRGSITYGEIYYTDKIVFGKDLIRAHDLEENHRMPYIVVDSNLKDVFKDKSIDYKEIIDLFDVWPNSELDYQDCITGIKKYLRQLNKHYVDSGVIEKIKWVIDRLNLYFEKEQKKKCVFKCEYKYSIEVIEEK